MVGKVVRFDYYGIPIVGRVLEVRRESVFIRCYPPYRKGRRKRYTSRGMDEVTLVS